MAADGVMALNYSERGRLFFGRPTAEALNASSPPVAAAGRRRPSRRGVAHVSAAPDGATCALRRRSRRVVRSVRMGGVYNLRRGGEACGAIEQREMG